MPYVGGGDQHHSFHHRIRGIEYDVVTNNRRQHGFIAPISTIEHPNRANRCHQGKGLQTSSCRGIVTICVMIGGEMAYGIDGMNGC